MLLKLLQRSIYSNKTIMNTAHKMKYWHGINFGDWQFLDRIVNIQSTNNIPTHNKYYCY